MPDTPLSAACAFFKVNKALILLTSKFLAEASMPKYGNALSAKGAFSVFFKTFIEIAEAVNKLKLNAVSNFSLFFCVKPF